MKTDGSKKTDYLFTKGKSGNPGGRTKRTPEELDLIAACKSKTPVALIVIEDIMRNGKNEKCKLSAAQYIIDRAYGKARESVTLSGDAENPIALLIKQLSGTSLQVKK